MRTNFAKGERPLTQDSYVRGDTAPPLIGATIGAYLDEVARRDGTREALVIPHQQVRWTYADLKARSDDFGAGLLSLRLEPGARIGIWAPRSPAGLLPHFPHPHARLPPPHTHPPSP